MRSTLASYIPGVEELIAAGPETFDATLEQYMAASPFLRWGFVDMAWKHGVVRPSELLADWERYTFAGEEHLIQARVLVIDAEDEGPRGQSRALYAALPEGRRDLITFTREEAAQFHVQPGATAILMHKMFDWVDTFIDR